MLIPFRSKLPPQMPALSPRLSILVVCTANLCRSPMAEGALRAMFARMGICADVDSAGTHDYGEGLRPCPIAVQTARRHGYDISRQVGRQVRHHDFRYFDLILAMDARNRRQLRRFAGRTARNKIMLLLDFSVEFRGGEVMDPFGRGEIAYEEAHQRIISGCVGVARYVAAASKTPSAMHSAAA